MRSHKQHSTFRRMRSYLDSVEESERGLMFPLIRPSGLAFLTLCVLVGFGVIQPIDWWGQAVLAPLPSSLLDLVGFFLTLLGEGSITGVVAGVLAWRGWLRSREYGLGPLLLFVGVGIEVLLKYVLPHPGPPAEFSRHLQLPAFLPFSTPVFLHVPTPYSFPSGHMLRTTFLVGLAGARRRQWRTPGWLVVLAMAFTRVYCNEHWVSDVVGGALLGWALAGVATALEREGKTRNIEPGERVQETTLLREKRVLS